MFDNIEPISDLSPDEVHDEFDLQLLGDNNSTDTNINQNLTPNQMKELGNLLKYFSDVLNSEPGRTDTLQHKINLHNSEPVRAKNYPVPINFVEEFDREIDRMLEMDIIQPSSSDYCSPVVFVRKPDGSLRLCIDFRALNKMTIFDAEPMPCINDDLHKFNNAKYFSELDLAKGYWQVKLEPESRKYTAFATKYGLMEFKVMPFGLNTASSTFVRLMRRVLTGLSNVSCYFDNIVVFSKTWKEHLNHLNLVFSRLRQHGLTAGPSKCFFGFQEIKYLGFN